MARKSAGLNMNESEKKPSEGQPAETQSQFLMQKAYLKDISYEAPDTPNIFGANTSPDMDIRFQIQSKPFKDDRPEIPTEDRYEVVLRVTVKSSISEATVFLIEVEQAGIFFIQGYDESERKGLISRVCPSVLFPFARETIWSILGRSGFPTMLIQPVQFDSFLASVPQEVEVEEG
jgi:preprotein translocase subunit SecB